MLSTTVHENVDVLELADSNDDDVVRLIESQSRKVPWWPFVFAAGVILGGVLISHIGTDSFGLFLAYLCVAFALVFWVRHLDGLRRLTVLFFEPDEKVASRFEALLQGADHARQCKGMDAIEETSQYADTKYSAGASSGIKLGKLSIAIGQATRVRANVDVPLVTSEKYTMGFYPDRILVMRGKSVAAVAYADLDSVAQQTRFVESRAVPRDAKVIDRTWQYVNKSGGPDRRFKNNPQYPVCLYQKLILQAPGLDVRWIASRSDAFDRLCMGLLKMKGAA